MNNLRTVVLLATISGLLIAVGGAVGGLGGVFLFGGIAVAMNIGSYWFSADIVLRSSHAREIEQSEDPRLFAMIEEVAARIDMPMPRVYVMDTPQPNAFATGRSPKHAAVAVTTGIRQMLTDRELRGVLGHEMAHVKNRDILTSSVVATIASAISLIAFISFFVGGRRGGISTLVTALIAPIAALRHRGRDQPLTRVPGRPRWRARRRRPRGARLRARQNRGRRATSAASGPRGDRPPLHREPVRRRQRAATLLDAPTDRGADSATPRPALSRDGTGSG